MSWPGESKLLVKAINYHTKALYQLICEHNKLNEYTVVSSITVSQGLYQCGHANNELKIRAKHTANRSVCRYLNPSTMNIVTTAVSNQGNATQLDTFMNCCAKWPLFATTHLASTAWRTWMATSIIESPNKPGFPGVNGLGCASLSLCKINLAQVGNHYLHCRIWLFKSNVTAFLEPQTSLLKILIRIILFHSINYTWMCQLHLFVVVHL